MVARNSPDWLPSGWTVQFKVQKTGRKIKCYLNLETGQKSFSMDDVIRYARLNSNDGRKSQPSNSHIRAHSRNKSTVCMKDKGRKPQPTNRCIKMHSRNKSEPVVLETYERPKWLPNGWNIEVKTRNSGSKIGSKYKCYVDPLTGSRFYSKPQVFQYLRTVKCSSRTFKKRKADSVPLVTKALVEKHKVEDLPAGWIKEIRIRKNGRGIRRDPYYTDPGNGCVFRSKKDVLRYLATGEISRNVLRPKKSCIGNEELVNSEISPSSAAKRQKLNDPATSRRLFADKGSSVKKSLESTEAKSSKRGQGNKVAGEETDAPTDEIIQDKHSMRDTIKESAETKKNLYPGRSILPKADGSKRKSQPKSLPANNGSDLTLAVDILQGKNDLKNLKNKNSTRKNQISLTNFKKKKEFNLPCRSSKRLAGLEPEQAVNSVSCQQAFQVSPIKFVESEDGDGPVPGLAPCILSNGASQQLEDGQDMVNAHSASIDMSDQPHGEPSDKSKNPVENKTASIRQPERLETEELDDEKRKQENCSIFGNSWSDPCLEFAIRTLTGALPVEDTNYRPVLSPSIDILQKANSLEGEVKKSGNKRTQINLEKSKRRKGLNLPRRSSKRLSGFEPEMVANSIFGEQALQNGSSTSCECEATPSVVLAVEASQQLESLLDMEFAHHAYNNINTPVPHHASNNISTPVLGESSKKIKKPLRFQIVEEKPQMSGVEIIPEPQLAFPFGDSWSDSCLEFAFKTLTGAIPVEDNVAVQGSFQEQLHVSQPRRDGSLALPDFGLPNFFQNDISSHFDSPEKSVAGHQPSTSSSFQAPGKMSLPSCGGIDSQQPCLEGNEDLHGKVNS